MCSGQKVLAQSTVCVEVKLHGQCKLLQVFLHKHCMVLFVPLQVVTLKTERGRPCTNFRAVNDIVWSCYHAICHFVCAWRLAAHHADV